jgi:hypothetical protein
MKLFIVVALLSGAVLLGRGCSSMTASDVASSGNACAGPNCQTAGGSKDRYDLVVSTGSGGSSGSTSTTATTTTNRCGLAAVGCNPDDNASCAHAVVNSGVGGSAAGGSSAGGAAGATSVGGDAGTTLACRVLFDNSVPLSQCEPDGNGLTGDTCVSRADCASGYGCVTENGTAQCRLYCCSGNDVCPSDTYCDEREIGEDTDAVIKHSVPVCVAGTACRFDDPYPCPTAQTCSCPTGRVCGVVRSDGTTACVVPGTGVEGEACPCAASYVCSDVLGTCVKTCSLLDVAASAEQCSLGVCQASASLPADVGICVSSTTLN